MRTRCWKSEETPTMVQFRTDSQPMVWLFTNLGWLSVDSPTNESEAEAFAEEVAQGYNLVEVSSEEALYWAGVMQ